MDRCFCKNGSSMNKTTQVTCCFLILTLWSGMAAPGPGWGTEGQTAGRSVEDSGLPVDDRPGLPVEVIQGEYLGWVVVDGVRRDYGLQVVARGHGKFTAGLLPGGLPSPSNLNPYPTKMSGEIVDGQLSLRSTGGLVFQLRTEPVYHFVQLDFQGQPLARLERVQRFSRSLGLAPPPSAVVLFRDGQAQELENVKLSPDGYLARGAVTRFPVEDFRLHVEFRLPLQAENSNQDRGNSGIYMQRRYEIQILDSFGEPPSQNNAASLYRQRAAMGNLSLPPLAWQTYDIWFTAARWSPSGEKVRNARVTLAHNGVVVHRDVEILTKTGAGAAEGPGPLPILFQDHSDPVEFRNVWLVHSSNATSPR
jgi:hypothetical protein